MSGGAYQVAFTPSARRWLRDLPEKIAVAAVEFIFGSLADAPNRVGKPLRLELEGLHTARRGDYRVIYRIDEPHREITVEVIAHRGDAYRPR